MILTLQRGGLEPAAYGHLSIDGIPETDTLERPWRENKTGISCIPPGKYQIIWAKSPRLQRYTLRLVGVPGRFGILIHPANHAEELQGCIALGKCLAPDTIMESKKAVSKVEVKVVQALNRGEAVWIEVKNP